jgi:hypothetical protein
VLVVEVPEHGGARVRRAVVDEDDLERLSARLERRGDLAVQLLERALLVQQGDDDGDHVGRVSASAGGFRSVLARLDRLIRLRIL